MTLTRETMFEPMLIACPGFRPEWEQCLKAEREAAQAGGYEAGLSVYSALRDLAGYLCNMLKDNPVNIQDAFAVIERWQTEGDAYVRTACSVGLFETVKHAGGPKDPEIWQKFRAALGPASRKEWDAA